MSEAASRQRPPLDAGALSGGPDGFDAPRDAKRILDERARQLARPRSAGAAEATTRLVLLKSGDETYGIEARFVFEVIRFDEAALLPGAELPIVGIIVWRGELLALVDFRSMLGLPGVGDVPSKQVLVVGAGRASFGVLVDSASEVLDLQESALHELPAASGEADGLVRGITREGVTVIDGKAVLRTLYGRSDP